MSVFIDLLFSLFAGHVVLNDPTYIEKMVYVIVSIEIIYHCMPLIMRVIRWFYKTFKSGCIRFNIMKGGDK